MSRKINDGLSNYQRWVRRHPDRVNAKTRRHYKAHAEDRRAYAKTRYYLVKDTEQHKETNRRGSYTHYVRNRKKCNEQSRLRCIERLRFLQELKNNTPCMDCSVQYPHYIMEFDHRDPVTKEVPFCSLLSRSWERIFAELDKCDIVCANCHNTRTWKRRQQLSLLTIESAVSTLPNSSPEVNSADLSLETPHSKGPMVN